VRKAEARAPVSRGGTSNADSSRATTEITPDPGMSDAITGLPARIASSSTMPKASARSIDGRQNTSQDSNAACSVASSTWPASVTRSARPRRSTCVRNSACSSPLPISSRLACGTCVIACSSTSKPL
jgi:hypothetical protein